MRRFVTLVFLLFFTIPFGISISGCSKKTVVTYCNGGDSGPVVGQIYSITLEPRLYGVSLNYAEIGQTSTPSATDCKGNAASASSYTYGTSDMTIADVQPTTGRLCGGTWNRNTPAIPDYTNCIATNKTGTAYITASTGGATSNPTVVYIHPVVTSVVLGSPALTAADCLTNPATNCSIDPISNQCVLSTVIGTTAPAYTGQACLSQGSTGQLAARVYAGTGASQQNISCLAGHLTYTPQDPNILTVDQNGIATAHQPGSTILNSFLSNASSSAGFFATCPPANITLSVPNSSSTNITVNQNFTQTITATVKDTNGVTLTGINLSFVSTTPSTLPSGGASSVTPIFPGSGSVVAVCQPPGCNEAPFNQIGLFGNGRAVVSNPISVTTPGTNSTVLYIASTQSQYLVPVDFTTGAVGAQVRLPYAPNSMVISTDGSSIYMGAANEIMSFSALSNTLTKEDPTLSGTVLAISPDGSTLVVTDPARQLIYLYSTGGGVQTTYGGVATHAQFSADNTTVYITAGNQLLVHSRFTGWTSISGSTIPSLTTPALDVATTVPNAGAFFAGATTTARSACPATTITNSNGQLTTNNIFYPDAGVVGPPTDRIAATNDGKHMLGVSAASGLLSDLRVTLAQPVQPGVDYSKLGVACPIPSATQTGAISFTSPFVTLPLGVNPTSITGVVPASDSSGAFVTYTAALASLPGQVPYYVPVASPDGTAVPGALTRVLLTGTATAPVSGVFSSDNTTFYTGTSGDNLVHILTKGGANGFQDVTAPITPALPGLTTGTIATPNLLVQRPRKQT